jgi:hypothetical protein
VTLPRQIWESLVSMVKVYAHAASLNGVACDVITSADAAVVTRKSCTLTIQCSQETGAGTWRLIHGDCEEWGEFSIDEHGALVFPAGPKELDAAAIDWIDQLVHVSNESLSVSPQDDLSSRPERTRISYVAALDPSTDAVFFKEDRMASANAAESGQEIRGSEVERSAVPLDNSPLLTEQL